MSDPDDFNALLKARFDREHQHVPAEPFVAAAMRRIRLERRHADVVRNSLWVAALVAAIIASPWLIAGAARLNALLVSSLNWTAGLPGAWMLGVLAVIVVLAARVRSR